jgi:quinol monooxygenase YgiN
MAAVAYLIELTIQEGKLDEFKKLAAGYTDAVRAGEPGTTEYQWWLFEDGTRGLLKESFDSSESMLTHLANVGPSLPDLLAIAPIPRAEVFGELSPEARTELDALGAKYTTHLVGFER